jgi:hypothetical protein
MLGAVHVAAAAPRRIKRRRVREQRDAHPWAAWPPSAGRWGDSLSRGRALMRQAGAGREPAGRGKRAGRATGAGCASAPSRARARGRGAHRERRTTATRAASAGAATRRRAWRDSGSQRGCAASSRAAGVPGRRRRAFGAKRGGRASEEAPLLLRHPASLLRRRPGASRRAQQRGRDGVPCRCATRQRAPPGSSAHERMHKH